METQKVLLERHRKGLDDKWNLKYPHGRFSIQITGDAPNLRYCLGWDRRRPTSHTRYAGVVLKSSFDNQDEYDDTAKWVPSYSVCPVNNTKLFRTSSMDKLTEKCNKEGISKRNLDIFLEKVKNFKIVRRD